MTGTWNFTPSGSAVPVTITHNSGAANGDFLVTGSAAGSSVQMRLLNTSATSLSASFLMLGTNLNYNTMQIAGANSGAVITGGPTGEHGLINTASASAPISIGTGSTERVRIGGSGVFALHNTSGISFIAFGELTNNGSTCVLNTSIDNFGISSCTRNSAGNVTITMANTAGLSYSCTANAVGSNNVALVSGRTTTTVSITTINLSAANTDANIVVTCF
jgi:hypothetical protein